MKEHAARLVRFQRIEIDGTRLVLSGIALALPVAVGAATGHVADGLTAVLGALLISAAGHEGGWRARCVDLGASAAVGALVIWLGALVGVQKLTVPVGLEQHSYRSHAPGLEGDT